MEKCKFDKYGCLNSFCLNHYPNIPRSAIISEMDSSKELRYGGIEKLTEDCSFKEIVDTVNKLIERL